MNTFLMGWRNEGFIVNHIKNEKQVLLLLHVSELSFRVLLLNT